MPWDHELCAAFYVAHPALPKPAGRLLDQLDRIGVTEVRVVQAPAERERAAGAVGERISGHWAGLDVEVRDRALDVFRVVTLVFPGAAVEAHGGGPATWPGLTPAFFRACAGLRPAAALVPDLAGPDVDQLVADREQWLVRANPVPLLHDGFALLYLSAAWFSGLDGFLRGLPYRRAPLADGQLLVGDHPDG